MNGAYRHSNTGTNENSDLALEYIFRWRAEWSVRFDLWHTLPQARCYLDELPPPSCPFKGLGGSPGFPFLEVDLFLYHLLGWVCCSKPLT
jgi:hypothetical protein